MIRSMSGYGEGVAEGAAARISATVRSVNHRYLDLAIRLPDDLRRFEAEVAAIVREAVHRGRIDVRIEVERLQEQRLEVRLRPEVLSGYVRAAARAREHGLAEGPLLAGDALRLPGVVELAPEGGEAAVESETLAAAVRHAVAGLVASRETEGARLALALRTLAAELSRQIGAIDERRKDVQDSYVARLEARLAELRQQAVPDADRIAQEAALLAERADVEEEIARLRAHIAAVETEIHEGGPAGRKLDFVMQETLRELNTIGAKARDSGAIELVLEAKLSCERLREQIQNVE